MADDRLMTIGEMSEAFDVTARTLRFYETKELLAPVREGSRRLYTRACRARLTLILRGKRFGFSLEEMRALLALRAEGEVVQLRATHAVAARRLAEMEAAAAELAASIAALKGEMAEAVERLSRADMAMTAGRMETGAAA